MQHWCRDEDQRALIGATRFQRLSLQALIQVVFERRGGLTALHIDHQATGQIAMRIRKRKENHMDQNSLE